MWWRHRERIRRFLRDPAGNIWTDDQLVRLWNDAQGETLQKAGHIDGVAALRVPPEFSGAYLFDWEWEYADKNGKPYQALHYHQDGGSVCTHVWETQIESGFESAAITDQEGMSFTHPWEAWYATNPHFDMAPLWFPDDFAEALWVAWDKQPLDYIDRRDMQSRDPSWMTRQGVPQFYTRREETENYFYLYPMPDAPVFDDTIGDEGMVSYDAGLDSENATTGVVIDWTGKFKDGDRGTVFDSVEADDNVFLIYRKRSVDFTGAEDQESIFPDFLTKYVEFGVLERAYSINTDGRIESLRDYWDLRKRAGFEVMNRLKIKKLADRDFRLRAGGTPGRRSRMHPRLPDAYPSTFP